MAIADGDQAGFAVARISVRADLIRLLINLGAEDRAMETVEQMNSAARHFSDAFSILWNNALLEVYLHTGQIDHAAELARNADSTPAIMRGLAPKLEATLVKVALAQHEYDVALERIESQMSIITTLQTRFAEPDYLQFKAQAQLGLGRVSEAEISLNAARELAEEIGVRWRLWQILAVEADLVAGDDARATKRREQARDVLTYIVNNIGDASLRESFLKRADVAAIMEIDLP
ncbi:MAG: hypothetical protein GY759_14535 [Chloroflexi bacterium]|nr:hypothetical protein [Chloroflexota bacterium]